MTKEELKLVIRERNKQRNNQSPVREHIRWSYKIDKQRRKAHIRWIESLMGKGYFAINERGAK